MESQSSLPYSQQPANSSCTKTGKSSPRHSISFNRYINIILPSMPRSCKWSLFPLGFPAKIPVIISLLNHTRQNPDQLIFCSASRILCFFMFMSYGHKKNIKFVHHTEILFNKTNRYTEFQIFIFGNATLHVSGSFPAHHQELSTVQSALAHFMQV